jgi:hypothetical protein
LICADYGEKKKMFKPKQAQMNTEALRTVLHALEHYLPYADENEVIMLAELITYFKEVITAGE